MNRRLIEIDALRGLALVGMILFHAAFDAMLLGLWDFEPYGWPLIIFVRTIQFLFLGLVGLSIALSSRDFFEQLKRGTFIFSMGMLVTFGTWLVFPEDFVRFGVLHCIAISIPLVRLLKGRKVLTLILAGVIFFVGEYFTTLSVDSQFLFPLGLLYPGFSSLDYFPIFPWLAVPLVGLVLGETIYGHRQPSFLQKLAWIPGLTSMGRHSLLIYLLHQPILYFGLWILHRVTFS